MNVRNELQNMKLYDPCVRVSPARIATLMLAVLELAEATELRGYCTQGAILPKVSGAFTYDGYPAHYRAIQHDGVMHIAFCSFHSGTAGNTGNTYLVFRENEMGNFIFYTSYTSSNVVDWVKRAFNEATATNSYPGLMSNTYHKRMTAMYEWCVANGMSPVT